MYGIQASGFVLKPLDVIKTEIEASLRATFGNGINLTPQSNFGQLVGIMAEREAILWQLAEAVYNALHPDSAGDVNLDNLSSLTGTARKPPSLTKVMATITGTAGTVLPAGRVASVNGSGARFVSVAEVTIGGGGTVAAEFEAEEAGPTPVYAGTLTVIETPAVGWTSITNAADHTVLGSELETDAALRMRRELELRSQGNAAIAPVRAKISNVANVLDVFVFENDTDAVNADGLPAHSIECVVDGGLDADIRAAIFAAKGGGIATYGTLSGVITDNQGTSHTVKHSRPTYLDAWVIVNVKIDAGTFPADGDAQIKAAIVAYGDANYTCGSDVISSALVPHAFKVTGVLDCQLPLIGTTNPPTTTNTIVTSLRQKPRLDTARITVNRI